MTHFVVSPAAHPAKVALLGQLVVLARMLWNKFQKERRVRSTASRLHRLNDRTLRDIGLERDKIEPVVRSRYLER